MSNAVEDADEAVKRNRERMKRLCAIQHHDPESAAMSLLEDLPVAKAVVKGEGQSLRASDKFYFRFFRISTKHVNRINSVFLQESYQLSTIIFKSHPAARKALEYYLKKNFFWLMETSMPDDEPRFERLRKLEQAAQLLGSEVPAVYNKLDGRTKETR